MYLTLKYILAVQVQLSLEICVILCINIIRLSTKVSILTRQRNRKGHKEHAKLYVDWLTYRFAENLTKRESF